VPRAATVWFSRPSDGWAAASRRWLASGTWPDWLSLACLGTLSCVFIATVGDYGLTYDEQPHIRYGERLLDFYLSGFRSSTGVSRSSYGAAFDLAAALLRRVSPWDEFRTNHVLCVFVAQLGLLGTWRLGRLVAGPLGGAFALLFLVLTPVYYGHQFNNPKDIPFAAGYIWGLYYIARLLIACGPGADAADPNAVARALGGWRYWVALSVSLGLGMSVRVGGALLVGYLVLFVALVTLDRWRVSSKASALVLRPVWWRSFGAIAGAWVLLLVSWPRALLSPVRGPQTALETVSKFAAYDSPTLLGGKVIPSQNVPWDYLPTYFLMQLPELTTACFIAASAGLLVVCANALRQRRPLPWMWLLLLVSVALPPAYAVVRHSTLYNGLRHFLFIIPPISVLAGASIAMLLRWSARRHLAWAGAVLVAMGVFSVDQGVWLWRMHPHQHAFFNRASGGLPNAVDRYETEYYGNVYPELLTRLTQEVWKTRREEYMRRTFVVTGCGSKLFFSRNLPQNFQFVGARSAQAADYYATYARDGCLRRFRDRALVARVDRGGAMLAVARDMKRKAKKPKRVVSDRGRR
jgi:hypothetical protein